MALIAKPVEGTLSTSTSATVDIVAPGLGTPKAAILWSSGATSKDTTEDHARMSFGFTDGTNEYVTSCFSQDAVGTSVAKSRAKSGALIMHIDGSSIIGEAAFNGWITDGIQLVMTAGFSSAFLVTCLLLTDDGVGNTLDNSFVGTGSVPGVFVGTVDNTDPGFHPDIILSIHGPATADNTHENNAQIGIGVANRDGVSANFHHGAATWFSGNGLATTASASQADTGDTKANNFISDNTNALGQLDFVSGDSSGFSYRQVDADATPFDFGYLCMQGTAFTNRFADGHSLSNATGDWTKNGVGFQPGCVLQIHSGASGSGNVDTAIPYGFSVGVFDTSDEFVQNIFSRDNVDTSDTNSTSKNTAIFNRNDLVTVSHEATFGSFNADGWVLNYTTANGTNFGASIAFDSQEPVAPAAIGETVTVTTPDGNRDTRLTLASPPSGTTKTQWQITPNGESSFTIQTTASGVNSSNVSSSDLQTLDIWLPPLHDYSLITRHFVSGSWGAWTAASEFASRNFLNSYEKYLALSGISGVDNIDVVE